jgi:iron complex outermembrane receptor protein
MWRTFKKVAAPLLSTAVLFGGLQGALYAQDDDDVFMLEEITVTAEKHTENVQDTAMSVSAITGSDIKSKSINDLQGALQRLAGVNIQALPGGGQVYIRGVGSGIDANLGDPSVSVSVDDVYSGRTESALSAMYDVERVEVLRGPQGTMYGRNATGGQINLISKSPTDEFESSANLSIGNYSLLKLGAVINVPLSETFSGRLAFNTENRDGYISDGSDSADKVAGRLKLSYKPTERFSILFTGELSDDQSSPANTVPVAGSAGNLSSNDWNDDLANTDEVDADGNDGSNGIPDIEDLGWTAENGATGVSAWDQDAYHYAPVMDNKFETYQIKFNYDMDWASIFFQPSYSQNERTLWSNMVDGSATSSDVTNSDFSEQSYEETQLTMDARISSPEDSKIDWIFGAYWADDDNDDANQDGDVDVIETSANNDDAWSTAQYRRPSEVYAFYGQTTVPVTEWFRATAGVRFTQDNRQLAYSLGDADLSEDDLAQIEEYGLDESKITELSDGTLQYDSGVVEYEDPQDNITYKGGLEVDLNEASLLYLMATTGFKAGGLNLQSAPFVTDYDAEELLAYSIGTKNRFMNNRLQVNAEAYYYDYDNYQVQIMTFEPDALTDDVKMMQATYNAETSHVMGLELEVDYMMSSSSRWDISLAFMDSEYGSLVLPAGAYSATDFDLDGRTMANAPDYSGLLGYEHYWNLSDGGSLTGRFEIKFSDGYYTTCEQYLPGAWQDSYHMSNSYLTYTEPNQKYSLGVWIKNIENADITVRTMPMYRRAIMAPRTYGVNFSIKF